MPRLLRILVLVAAPTALAADPDEIIKVPCKEYQLLTGDSLPCDTIPVLKMKRSAYDSAKAARELKACKDGVLAKYRKWIKVTESGTWHQDIPPTDSKEPWISCQPTRLWDGENIRYDCYEELEACSSPDSEQPQAPSGEKTKEQIKLF